MLALFFIAFLNLYIPSYVTQNDSEIVSYIISFADRLFEFALPLVCASMVLFSGAITPGAIAARISIISISTLAYNLPYYYLVYLAQGNDSIEATLISLGVSAIAYVVFAALSLAYYLIMRCVTVRHARAEYIEQLPIAYRKNTPKDMLKQARTDVLADLDIHLAKKGMFNLSVPISFGIFAACFAQFCISILYELVCLVIELIESGGNYGADTIVYLAVIMIFIFAELFASCAICNLVKYIIIKVENDHGNDQALAQ